ncbi:hypothetical protein BGZ58_002452 [Dissophora ornata]|nr:hypothetical protein BGZ58_002452 [Dissophora ornata]
MSKHEIKLTSLKETSRAMMTLFEGSYTIDDPSGEAWKGFPSYLEGFGKPEVGLSLEQFSMQSTSISDWTDDEIDAHFGLATYPDARKIITLFGASMFGKVVEYGGISGYYPKHVREIELSHCGPEDPNEPLSEIFKAHNMEVYGSGGLEFIHNDLNELLNSAKPIDSNARQYANQDDTQRSFTKFQRFKERHTVEFVLFDTVNRKLAISETSTTYVAISHVWFQGVFDLRGKVIEQLRDIYQFARATLVVDVGLISTAARTVLDLSLAISLSDWSSRVWTLQEGVLASKLLFCVGEQVLALPQPHGPDLLVDTRNMVPSIALKAYGLGNDGLGQDLEVLFSFAANRQTSHQVDYLYGLSALLPTVPKNRDQGLEQVAIEVAQMYGSVDLGILQVPLDRCRAEGYRWMPLAAQTMFKVIQTGVMGQVLGMGLLCPITAFIKLDTYTDGSTEGFNKRDAELSVLMDMNVKYWHPTEKPGAFVGTSVEADNMIFCLLGHADEFRSFGFVVSPTNSPEKFQYVGEAVVYGTVLANPKRILVT